MAPEWADLMLHGCFAPAVIGQAATRPVAAVLVDGAIAQSKVPYSVSGSNAGICMVIVEKDTLSTPPSAERRGSLKVVAG